MARTANDLARHYTPFGACHPVAGLGCLGCGRPEMRIVAMISRRSTFQILMRAKASPMMSTFEPFSPTRYPPSSK
jgi:hypothetical protein